MKNNTKIEEKSLLWLFENYLVKELKNRKHKKKEVSKEKQTLTYRPMYIVIIIYILYS